MFIKKRQVRPRLHGVPVRMVTTSNSVSLRSYSFPPLFPCLVVIKFFNININLKAIVVLKPFDVIS